MITAPSLAAQQAHPFVREDAAQRVSDHVWIILDENVRFVPNVGIIVGDRATLVIETGLGTRNGEIVYREARKINSNNQMYLVATHYHPEHAGGTMAFPPDVQFVVSEAQQKELDKLAIGMAERFAGFSPVMGELLEGVEFRRGDIMFAREHRIDLGGVTVRLMSLGSTHTRGDTGIFVEGDGVLFAGDIVMNRAFLAFNRSSSAKTWLEVFDYFEALNPTTIVPSHGAIGDASLIDAQRTVVKGLTDRARELDASGQLMSDAAELLTAEYRAAYPDWTSPNRIGAAVRAIWAELP